MNLYNKYSFLISEKLSGYKKEKKRFHEKTGYHLDLKQPTTFCEKLMYKKIYDRNPLLHITADKYMVRNYLTEKLGKERAEKLLVPLLYVTDQPEKIPFKILPERYIIKANHASGWNIIVNEGNVKPNDIINQCKTWLSDTYGFYKHEWMYQKIKRRIIIEALLLDEHGDIPREYKFFVFNGKCKMVCVICNRFQSKPTTISLFDEKWSYLNVKYEFEKGPPLDKPKNHEEMLFLAEELGLPFDFTRIDLYSINDSILFSEFTHYPTSGMPVIEPKSFDYQLGSYWKLDPNYWK